MPDYPKIVVRPPGPKARELVKRDSDAISPSYTRYYPLVIDSGKNCVVKDVDGNEYIDFNSGVACLNVGHRHPKVVKAIKSQCDKFLHYANTDFYYQQTVNLAEKLFKITPGTFQKKVHLANSGAEAIETAIKLSKWHTRKHQFIAFTGAFHGRTCGATALTASKPTQRRHYFPLLPGITHVPYPHCYRCPFGLSHPECNYRCVDFIDEQVLQKYLPAEEVAGFVFEPSDAPADSPLAPAMANSPAAAVPAAPTAPDFGFVSASSDSPAVAAAAPAAASAPPAARSPAPP